MPDVPLVRDEVRGEGFLLSMRRELPAELSGGVPGDGGGGSARDPWDCLLLLKAHPLGEGGREAIDPNYLHHLLVRRWGVWYTATKNLRNVTGGFTAAAERPRGRAARLSAYPEVAGLQGGMLWRARSLVGDRVRWFRMVDGQAAAERGLRR